MNAIITEFIQMSKQLFENCKQYYDKEYSVAGTRAAPILIYTASILALTRVSWFVFGLLWSVALFVWDSLTPGQKWIELLSILSSIGTFVFLACIINDFEQGLDQAFTKLKKEIADKTAIIAQQQEKIAKMEAIIAEVTNLSDAN